MDLWDGDCYDDVTRWARGWGCQCGTTRVGKMDGLVRLESSVSVRALTTDGHAYLMPLLQPCSCIITNDLW